MTGRPRLGVALVVLGAVALGALVLAILEERGGAPSVGAGLEPLPPVTSGQVGHDAPAPVDVPPEGLSSPPAAPSDGRGASTQDLLAAVEQGDAARVAGIAVGLGAARLDVAEGGMTALMRAAAVGDVAVMEALLAAGAGPDARGAQARTALQYAVHGNHFRAVEVLLEAGAGVDEADAGELTPLVMAADRNHADIALRLLEAGADPKRANHAGYTALIDAARHGNEVLVSRLLALGAPPTSATARAGPRSTSPRGPDISR